MTFRSTSSVASGCWARTTSSSGAERGKILRDRRLRGGPRAAPARPNRGRRVAAHRRQLHSRLERRPEHTTLPAHQTDLLIAPDQGAKTFYQAVQFLWSVSIILNRNDPPDARLY
jgi:hypothetical protein